MSTLVRYTAPNNAYATRQTEKIDWGTNAYKSITVCIAGMPPLVCKSPANACARTKRTNSDAFIDPIHRESLLGYEKTVKHYREFYHFFEFCSDVNPWLKTVHDFIFKIYTLVVEKLRLLMIYDMFDALFRIIDSAKTIGTNAPGIKILKKQLFIASMESGLKGAERSMVDVVKSCQQTFLLSNGQQNIEFPHVIEYYRQLICAWDVMAKEFDFKFNFDTLCGMLENAECALNSILDAQRDGMIARSPPLTFGLKMSDVEATIKTPNNLSKPSKKRKEKREKDTSHMNTSAESSNIDFLSPEMAAELLMAFHNAVASM